LSDALGKEHAMVVEAALAYLAIVAMVHIPVFMLDIALLAIEVLYSVFVLEVLWHVREVV